MKRTKHIDLNMMRKVSEKKRPFLNPLAIGIAIVTLTSCSSQEAVKVVNSPEECVKTSGLTLVECQAAYQKAQAEAERTGPKYKSTSECESEFGSGRCTQSRSGGYFMPMMTGFIMGRMLSGGNYGGSGYNPVYQYNGPNSAQHNKIMTADGTIIGKPGQNSYRVDNSTLKTKPSVTRTVSRGGFGATASAKSSWGGGKSSGWGG
ncbi:MAG: DUF1190 domain-containing protein [Pseudomonadota bacterium]